MRIAFGCDHRGGRIAYAILTGVLFPENGAGNEALEAFEKAGGIIHQSGNNSSLVGAYLFSSSGDIFQPNFKSPPQVQNLLSGLEDSIKAGNETGLVPPIDYPDIAGVVAEQVSTGKADIGILVCATGIGMCIVANKFRGIRAATCYNVQSAELSRRHNNANILCVPGEIVGSPVAVTMVKKWLSTEYDGGRHQRRLEKISFIEEETGL